MYHRLRNTVCACVSAVIALCLAARPALAASPKEVDDAIKKAKAYIYSQMKDDTWESVPAPKGTGRADPDGRQWGGTTGLAVYGLLAAGENPQDARLAKAIEWLKTAQIEGNYAAGMRSQVWTFLKNEREAKLASTPDFKLLLNGLLSDKRVGLYSYYTDAKTGKPEDKWSDHSVSQYGVLGMWACEQAGQEVPTKYWEIVDARWKKDQKPDGGWNYNDDAEFNGGGKTTGTMTAAGVATLYITQDYLLQKNDWGRCNGGVRNEHIERGLAWMDKHVEGMIKSDSHYYYALYGIERIGVASGRKYFGTVDWYQLGADQLIKKQGKDGSWGKPGNPHNPKGIADTCFATIFLVRGRAPVIMNKLEYGDVAAAAPADQKAVGSSRVDLQACKLEYSIVSPK